MHRYADLRKNKISNFQGNLVVSNKRRQKQVKREYPIGLWMIILFMVTVSVLYIRYQALHVEDSVFRDAYKLIDEHFLSKDPLPPVNQNLSDQVNPVVSTPSVPLTQNSVNGVTPMNPSVGVPVNHGNIVVDNPNVNVSRSSSVSGSPDRNEINSVGVASSLPSSKVPTTSPNQVALSDPRGMVMPNGNSEIHYQQGTEQGVVAGHPYDVNAMNNPVTSVPTIVENQPVSSEPMQEKIFTYYYPILNSKSTKVGFFVVNKKTTYQNSSFYQSLFDHLVSFQSSNPKVRNFFDPRTRLKNAWIENDTLLLDFNSAFENSKYGYKGIEVKIQQVLWTFFNYDKDAVNRISYISFLVEGTRKDIIGGDGKVLKPFYSRKDLTTIITMAL